ncbi:MAG TPA: hypothetical protein VNC22_02120 [Sporichthya sp.]|nr:hypothetical protein [Sporichthya sp.]
MGAVSYGIRLEFPPGWLELPEPTSAVTSWARDIAEELWSIQPAPPTGAQVDELAAHLAALAADCPAHAPLIRLALLVSPTMPVVVTGEIRQLAPDDESSPFSPDALAEQCRQPDKALTRPAEVSLVDLPAGPAVRVRRTVRQPRQGFRRPVVEELLFAIFPPQLQREGILLSTTWTDLVLGDVHATEVDELAAGLTLDFDQE